MNFHETPLIFFTVLTQGAIGAFWWCFLALMFTGISVDKQVALRRSMLLIWIMMAVAVLLSMGHLGTPLRAFNSLFRIGQAPLSNEILGAALFAGFGGLAWLLGIGHGKPSGAYKALLCITFVCSVFFLWAISMVYKIPTVPFWNTPLTLLGFFATSLIVGSAIAAFLFTATKSAEVLILKCGPLLMAGLGVLIGIAVLITLMADLPTAHFALKDPQALIEGIRCWSVTRFVLLLIGIFLWFIHYKRCQPQQSGALLMALVVIVLALGEMTGRLVFYSLNMTIGLI